MADAALTRPDPVPELEDQLHAAATAEAGLDNFGPDDYREGLRRVLDEIEPAVEGRERDLARGVVVELLVSRLVSQEGWRTRPDCLDRAVGAPLVITGIPRTGTTVLHQLLSMDPRFQVVEAWLIDRPKVRPPRERWADDPEYQAAVARAAMIPSDIKALHFAEPHEADECLMLIAQSFVTNRFGSTMWVPGYDEWFLAQDMTPSFCRYADNLRLIGADQPDTRWLLKNPSHCLAMDTLFAVFPDAQVIHTHREPRAAMASLVSLASRFITFDLSRYRDRMMHIWGEGMRRMSHVRAGRPESFHDVHYDALIANPIEVVMTIYERFGLELEPATLTVMREWLRDNPQGKHGAHRYRPEDFGITDASIHHYFADYLAEFSMRA